MSTNNMAKRTAAGTLALAVCLSGGALALAGSANAALPTASDLTGSAATSANGTSASQVLRTSAQSLTDFSVTLGASTSGVSRWFSGDRIVVQLPANVAFSSAPTVTAVKVAGDGTAAPTFTVAALASTDDPSTDLNGPGGGANAGNGGDDAVAAVRQYAVTFTNSQGTTAADNLSNWKLQFSGVKVDLTNFTGGAIGLGGSAATQSATSDGFGKIYGQTYDANGGTFTNTYVYTDQTGVIDTADVIGYTLDAKVSIASNYTFVNGGGVQAAPDVTISEPFAGSWTGSTATIQFRDSAGTPAIVAIDGTAGNLAIGAPLSPTLNVNGTAITSGNFVLGASGATLTTPTISGLSSSVVDKAVIGNIRFANATGLVGPIKAYVTSPAPTQVSGVNGFQAVSDTVTINDPNTRLGGASRYDTAAQIVAKRFPTVGARDFVLASGEGSGVDALSANYVAGAGTDRPVVLVGKDYLPDATLAYLKSVMGTGNTTTPVPAKFTVLGGRAAISDSVMQQIKDAFPGFVVTFTRSAGDDRYETAAAAAINMGGDSIATFSNVYGKPAVRTAILASGENPADATSAGALAYGANFPLLLTAKGSLPSATVNALQTLEIKQVIIVGGTSAVSADVETKLKGMGVTIIRKAGDDRFGTALQIAEFARSPKVDSVNVKTDGGLGWNTATYNSTGTTWAAAGTGTLLGNGYGFADVLAAGQLSAGATPTVNSYQPVLTTDGAALSDSTKKWLVDHKASITGVIGLGGASAVSWDALTAAVNAQK